MEHIFEETKKFRKEYFNFIYNSSKKQINMKKFKNVLQIRISLKDIKPTIFRTIYFPANSGFLELHAVIQEVMGWDTSHLFCFRKGRDLNIGIPNDDFEYIEVIDIKKIKLEGLLEKPKDSIIYEYDFGDGWEHKVEVQKIFDEIELPHLPYCIKGANACPMEDCGGSWGYSDILDAFKDKKHPQYDELNEWYHFENFDPEEFDIDYINEELKDFKTSVQYHKDVIKQIEKSF
jgi:hypothetical protein